MVILVSLKYLCQKGIRIRPLLLALSIPLLKHNLPIKTLGGPPPPKGDPVFELKQLPDTLKYAYLDEKKIYHVIISANLSEHEEERLLF